MPDLFTGQRVKLNQDIKDLHHGNRVFKTGSLGTLGQMYRTQDGLQVWEVILDEKESIGSGLINIRTCTVHIKLIKV